MRPIDCPGCGQVLAAVLDDGRIILEADWRPDKYRFAGTVVPAWWFRRAREQFRDGRPGHAADRYVRSWDRYDAGYVRPRHEPQVPFVVLAGSIVTCKCKLEVPLHP